MALEFAKRAKVRETDTSRLRRWSSSCGEYAVVESKSRLGLATRHLAIHVLVDGGEEIIGRHPTRRAAERRCQSHAKP